MTTIKVLDDSTIGKIAAGEVIERPASVVKELVENSLDAGAKRIAVTISDGGLKLIGVMDDGMGMSPDDAQLAFERHATSKLTSIDDLERISTMGFRGEALASIAAVARVEFQTRRADDEAGTRVSMEGGKLKDSGPIGCPAGTRIEVRDIFFNVPARRKYLKSKRTEMAHVQEVITERALLNPGVHFSLVHDGNVLMSSPASDDPRDKLVYVFGSRLAGEMLVVDGGAAGIRVNGYLATPEHARSSYSHLYLSVNGRPVKEPQLNRAVSDGYGTLLMKGQYPVGVISINLPADKLDVNVHPAKTEVRFSNERAVLDAVRAAVASVFAGRVMERKADSYGFVTSGPAPDAHVADTSAGEWRTAPIGAQATLDAPAADPVEMTAGRRYIGQLWDTYLLFQRGGEFVLLDQHAAHERVRYEKLRRQYAKDSVRTQELITPVIMELRPKEFAVVMDAAERLSRLGVSVEEFGSNTVQVRTLPVVLGRANGEEVVKGLVDRLLDSGGLKLGEEFAEALIKTMACHSAIRAGEPLEPARISKLLDELAACKNPNSCPHGRPVSIALSREELEKKFKRRV